MRVDPRPEPPAEDDAASAPSPALERLRRWEAAGGEWRLVTIGPTAATVQLDRCDLGETVDLISSADADFLRHLTRHSEHGERDD
jgi:hypothetical protein